MWRLMGERPQPALREWARGAVFPRSNGDAFPASRAEGNHGRKKAKRSPCAGRRRREAPSAAWDAPLRDARRPAASVSRSAAVECARFARFAWFAWFACFAVIRIPFPSVIRAATRRISNFSFPALPRSCIFIRRVPFSRIRLRRPFPIVCGKGAVAVCP